MEAEEEGQWWKMRALHADEEVAALAKRVREVEKSQARMQEEFHLAAFREVFLKGTVAALEKGIAKKSQMIQVLREVVQEKDPRPRYAGIGQEAVD